MPKIQKLNTATLPQGEALTAYLTLVEKYKIQNPVKYQLKKATFDKKLSELGYNAK
jgi:hypothetical protein